MKHLIARVSGLSAAAMLFLFGSVGTAQTVQAQAEQVSDQDKAVHYSLYYEDFKNENYESALPNLKWIIQKAPAYPRSNDRNFRRLVETYAGLAAKADDEETKRQYLDSALVVFDEVVPTLQEHEIEVDELQWKIRKGRFIQEHNEALSDRSSEVADIYLEAYEMGGCEIDPYYIRVIIDRYARSGEKQQAVDLMDESEECFGDNQEMMAYITEVRDNLFQSPQERMTFLESRLEKNPEDLEVASELFDIYLDVGERQKAAALGDRLVNMEKTPRTYRMLGQLHLQDGEAGKALEYYQEALDLPGATDEVKRDIHFNMGIAQQQLGRLSSARASFRQALEFDPNHGSAYIAIGDLYVTAVSECGSFEPEDRAVYWLAVDQYERARSVDPSVASQASQKISTYRNSFPSQENLFFKGWEPGQSYNINYGCYSWIGQSTTVRQP